VVPPTLPPDLAPTLPAAAGANVVAPVAPALPPLLLDNGIGGFTPDGREYVIRTGPGRPTPAPWANVLASPLFGSVVSDSGAAYSWNQNASAFRLTPWEEDSAPAHGGEAFYLRDEQTGMYWSPTALPAPSGGEYLTRHGFGYSTFEHSAHGIHSTLLTWVALDAPRKYTVVTLRNDSAAVRRLSVTGYVEWVLGATRAQAAPHVVTERDPASGALFARNGHDPEFADRVAFFCLDAAQVANVVYTCDRAEFIGHGRSLAQPAALVRTSLSGRSGAALDPCGALQTVVELQPGEARELVFMLGIGVPEEHQRGAAAADLARVRAFWDDTLGAVRIDTPEPAFDVLANGWLMYQTIACRLWARSAYYQSDGAYDFRGQLQDAMATVHLRPELLRDHILLFARHQFVEGDVQQRWHPPGGVGLRTHCAHDALWLPLAVARHVEVTGDMALLDEIAPFIEGRPLVPDGAADEAPDEAPRWEVPLPSLEQASVYEHCVRAVRRALVFGAHGLPLADSADRGEDVGLAFLLVDVLRRFGDVAERHADYGFATTCRSAAQVLTRNIEDNAWDGACYRHPHDAPSPVDPDAQSWGVLSGAADPERARSAMARAFDLAAAAADDSSADASGIHAIRAAMAFAQLGNTARAWTLAHGLNPAVQASTPAGCAAYALEPYVMAAPHEAGGGSWTTGAAGWMYRLIVESLLGIGRRGDTLTLTPHLPAAWDGFRVHYRHGSSVYTIAVQRGATHALQVDGAARAGNAITLVDDGGMHAVLLQVPGHQDAGPATGATDTASQE
jgi:cyclic beta-1,2-glucan synthetase